MLCALRFLQSKACAASRRITTCRMYSWLSLPDYPPSSLLCAHGRHIPNVIPTRRQPLPGYQAQQNKLDCFDPPFEARIQTAMSMRSIATKIQSNYRKNPLRFVLGLAFWLAWGSRIIFEKPEYLAQHRQIEILTASLEGIALILAIIFFIARMGETPSKHSTCESPALDSPVETPLSH
jgi:hypothetical protein